MEAAECSTMHGGDESAVPAEALPRRSRICAVCSTVSDNFYLNYGAAVCFSCRAFFRRVNSIDVEGRTAPRPLICKVGGGCEVSVDNRKCRKCRYDRCLTAGMNPDAVLDVKGKKVRFRKMLKKKMLAPGKEEDAIRRRQMILSKVGFVSK
jgi:hypothetical protein